MRKQNVKRGRKWVSVVAALLAVLMILPMIISAMTTALAITTPEIEKLQAQAKELEQQKEELQEELEAMEDNKATTIQKKVAVDREMELTSQEIDNITALIQQYTLEISEQQEALDKAMLQEEEESERYQKRLRAMEEMGTVSYIGVLFQADSFTDFLDRLTMVNEILDYNQKVIDELKATRSQIEETKAAIEENQAEQAAYQETLLEKQAELEEQSAQAMELVQIIKDQIQETEEDIAAKEAAEAELQNEIAELVKQAEQEEAERQRREEWEQQQQQWANSGGSSSGGYTSTTFAWPLPGYTTISSPYGMRFHPTLHVYKLHTGTDISAPKGTTIVAAAPGTVITAGYNAAYGNYVVIHHGNGTQTLYGHMSRLATTKGATVSAGDKIGEVGMTGYATGNHLHFEVIINGQQVNPMQYFS